MNKDQLNTDVSRRRWLAAVALAATGGMTACSSGTGGSEARQAQADPTRSEVSEPYKEARLMLFGKAQTRSFPHWTSTRC